MITKPINYTLDDFTREMITLIDEHLSHGQYRLSLLEAREAMMEGCSEEIANHILLSAFLAGNEYMERITSLASHSQRRTMFTKNREEMTVATGRQSRP